ncbi:hypothetical protein J5N97_005629 [Dioscorea zingiberensis]|uniref:Uncharacterized protein n=1 Tax=Dioscorea zingiberensis TaxID=325984 RepID=A0A9D5HSI5_9LILI|nr:hypothetical protein J5N97_005629 [Dioscorea zingiberensis]
MLRWLLVRKRVAWRGLGWSAKLVLSVNFEMMMDLVGELVVGDDDGVVPEAYVEGDDGPIARDEFLDGLCNNKLVTVEQQPSPKTPNPPKSYRCSSNPSLWL